MEESECVVSGGDGRVTRLSTLLRQVQIPSIAVRRMGVARETNTVTH